MGRIRRSFDIQFKMKVCEAIERGDRAVLEICREFQLQRAVVEGWMKKYLRGDLTPKSKTRESDYERDLAYTKELVSGLTNDEKYAEENRTLFSSWLEEPIADSLSAARALEPIWSVADATPGRFDDALSRARERVRGILDELDIPTPKELDR